MTQTSEPELLHSPISSRNETRATRARRFFFGDDVFISYSRHNSDYAQSLADKLIGKELSCYVDLWGSKSDAKLPAELLDKLNKSTMLVLIGTEAAIKSAHVRQEVVRFKQTGRPIVPITFLEQEEFLRIRGGALPENLRGTLEGATWSDEIAGIARTIESKEMLNHDQKGKVLGPSDQVINRIVNARGFQSRSRRLRQIFWITLVSLFVLLIAAGVITSVLIDRANKQMRQARLDQATAEKARDAANTARTIAEGQMREAQTKLGIARGELTQATTDLKTA